MYTVGLLNKSAQEAVGGGISEKCGTPTFYREARSLETSAGLSIRVFQPSWICLVRRFTKARKSLIIKLHRTLLLRSLEMNAVAFETSTVVGILLDHELGEVLLLRSPTVHHSIVISEGNNDIKFI